MKNIGAVLILRSELPLVKDGELTSFLYHKPQTGKADSCQSPFLGCLVHSLSPALQMFF